MSYVSSYPSETSYDQVRAWARERRQTLKKKQSRDVALFWNGAVAGALLGSVWLSTWLAWVFL
jgi:hypothetical protein